MIQRSVSRLTSREASRIGKRRRAGNTTNRLSIQALEARQLLAFNIVDDAFSLAADTSGVNVLTNDTAGNETQAVSAKNVEVDKLTANRAANTADNFIPDRPGQPGVPQRSVFDGAITLWRPQQNYGDVDLYVDLDDDPATDAELLLLRRLNLTEGIVLGTLMENAELDEARNNLAVVQYTSNAAGDAWIATNAAPENNGEQAANYSAAYFPYAAGWRGASFDGNPSVSPGGVAQLRGGDAGIVAVGSAGVYEVTVSGVTDSFNEGFLFVIGGDNQDNYARAMPLGGNRWSVIHRDNANGIDGSETAVAVQRFNVLYVPRAAQGLIGGVVNGRVSDANPMLQSFGDFNIQRQSDGIWKLTVPGQSITSGAVVLETVDTSRGKPRNTYFTYEVDPNDSQAILIRQFDYNGSAQLANEDFVFFFVPFENTIRPQTPLVISRLGSTAGTLGNNVSALGIPLSLNADGTVNYSTGSQILGLGQGQSAVDSFVYEVEYQSGEQLLVGTATATIHWNGVNDAPVILSELADLQFSRNGAAQNLDASSFFSDPDVDDVLTYSVAFSTPDIVTGSVVGSTVTVTPVTGASGTVEITITATDPYGATASVMAVVSVLGLDAIDDTFFVSSDTVLSILNNDRSGSETQNISAMNVALLGPQDRPANTGLSFIPDRPDSPGVPQRSIYAGAMTINPLQNNYADYNLHLDSDSDPTNDSGANPRIPRGSGIVLATLLDNSPLDATANNLAVVQYTANASGAWIATNAAPQNGVDTANQGEKAAPFSAAYFPYASGWVGGSYNGTAGTLAGGAGLTVTGSGGRYEATVAGVTDSFAEGFLFGIGADNSDNYTRTRPVGGDRWLVQHRDNAHGLTQAEQNSFNVLYIPRSAPGLIGGVVNGTSDVVNPMRQSFGDFSIQRESDGFWRLSVPGHSPASGVLVMETMDLSVDVPRNSYFTYEPAADNPSEFLIRQFDFISASNTANPQNGDFVFFFIPFENVIQSSTSITVASVGSSAATLGNNLTSKGIPITVNPDGTVNYDTGGAIRALGEGQTDTDTFVYRAQLGSETDLATVTINWVGANDAPEVIATPAEIDLLEDSSTQLDLAAIFSDPDASDVLTYSVSFSRGDIIDATIVGTTLTFTGLENQFGFVQATVTATDPFGASASVVIPISVIGTLDGPMAVDDSLVAQKQSLVTIDVLANDLHPDTGLFPVVSANIFGNPEAANDAQTAWEVLPNGAPNQFTLIGPQNRGDLALGVDGEPITPRDGVLLGTIRDDSFPFGSVNVWSWAARGDTLTFATELGAGGNGERNAPLGAAYFPYAEGWVGGQVATDGTLLNGNGVNQSDITKVQTGLWTVSIPGVADSNTDGLLFVIGGNNDDNFMSVLPLGNNTWGVRQADNDTGDTGFEDDPFFFVYIPYSTVDLVAGRWASGSINEEDEGAEPVPGGIIASSGTFTATETANQSVIIEIQGESPTTGSLIVIPNEAQKVLLPDGSEVEIPVNYGAFYASTVDGKFEVTLRQGPDFVLVDSGFQFVFVPFETPLRTDAAIAGETSVLSVSPVSALGASVSINPDGTVAYDSTSAGGAIAALAPGQSVVDTFSYTVIDGNGLTSSATVSVTNYNAPTAELSAAPLSIAENGGAAVVTATLSVVSSLDVTIALSVGGTATIGSDFTLSSQEIFIPAGQLTGSVTLTALGDELVEGDETVVIGFGAVTNVLPGTVQEVTITITDGPVDVTPPTITSVKVAGSSWSPGFIGALDAAGVGYELIDAVPLPWAGINRIYVQFSEPVVGFSAANVALTGVNLPSYAASIASVQYDTDLMRGVIELSTPLSIDRLRVAVSDAVTDTAGNALDGDGSSTAGGSFSRLFGVLIGDVNGDGSVNAGDISGFAASFNQSVGVPAYNQRLDWNGDGSVNAGDIAFFGPSFNQSLPAGTPLMPFGGLPAPSPAALDSLFAGDDEELDLLSDAVNSLF